MKVRHLLTAPGHFVGAWWASRKWSSLGRAVPAIAVAGLLTCGWIVHRSASDTARQTAIVRAADKAFSDKNFESAKFLYGKALRSEPQSKKLAFRRSLVLKELGNHDLAQRQMQALAPLDGAKGYADAHRWFIQQYFVEDAPDRVSEEGLRIHCERLLQHEPGNALASRVMVDHAMKTSDLKSALRHFPAVVDQFPDMRIRYAKALYSSGDRNASRQQAQSAIEYLRNEFKKATDAQREVSFFVDWAAAHAICDEYATAVDVLNSGAKQAAATRQDQRPYLQAAARITVAWTIHLERTVPNSENSQLELLGNAIRLNPNDPSLLARIARLSGAVASANGIATEALYAALADGTAPPMVHFLLGTQAALKNDAANARRHLERAIKMQPRALASLNNLAWTIAHAEPPDLPGALRLVDEAIVVDPGHAQVRDTRGQILILMERWAEAIDELEIALRDMKNEPHVHRSLALAYEHLGDTTLAKLHADKAGDLATKPEHGG